MISYTYFTLENSGTVSMSIVQSSIIKNLLNIAREMDLHMACIMDNVCGISTETLSTVWDVVYGHAGILYIYGYKQRGGQVIPKEEHKAAPKEIERPKTQENPEPPKKTKEELRQEAIAECEAEDPEFTENNPGYCERHVRVP